MYAKSVGRDKLENEFANILKNIQPTKSLAELVHEMFGQAWDMQAAKASEQSLVFKKELATTEKEIDQLLDCILTASNARVVQVYEKRIEELEHQRLILEEKATKTAAPTHGFSEMFELAMLFFANPYKLWRSERFTLRRIVLKLVFKDKMLCYRKEGYRTPKTTLIFSDLGHICAKGIKMVLRRGLNSNRVEEFLVAFKEWMVVFKQPHALNQKKSD